MFVSDIKNEQQYIFFLNHKKNQCGVYQYGKRVSEILKKSDDICYVYFELETIEEYQEILKNSSSLFKNLIGIIYNYHAVTMQWLNNNTIQKNVKNIGIPHESNDMQMFDIVCNIDCTAKDTLNSISLPRPIYENIDNILSKHIYSTNKIREFIEYNEENIPIFGSFGFGFDSKGFDKIVNLINKNYDKAIIKFVIPTAFFDSNSREQTIIDTALKCRNENTKSSIKLMITHDFFSNEDILKFLHTNTMNMFEYDYMHQRSISSVIDYALSVKRPLGISNSCMFRHIYSDKICLSVTPINRCLIDSVEYCSSFLEKYSNKNLIDKFKYIVNILRRI